MNSKTSKLIRSIINYNPKESDEKIRRVYIRAKEQYKKLSKGAKPIFLQELKNLYNTNK